MIHVLRLTWVMAGLSASYQGMVGPNSAICVCVKRCVSFESGSGRRGLAPGSPSVVSIRAMSFNSNILPAQNPSEHGML
jgi:hypothetical protein